MLTEDEFRRLAQLCRLDPDDTSVAAVRDDFNKILDYVDSIKAAEIGAVSVSPGEDDTRNTLRVDQAQAPLSAAEIAAIAPRWEAGHFVVPGAIESEG
ncbi:MAG: Asp-tRNA(Asn)/Glu-tRNA(Gln) amidotransferase subunit GatC [Leptospirales bacterium]|nr:Asp-tRNA(Asn)/Glu-tRNA(Gln) amidotransferase subunit GatC [Leptospirales bacterium]